MVIHGQNLEPKSFKDLKGKVVLITGAGGILGTSFAKGYAALGAKLILVDLKEDHLVKLKHQIEELIKCEILLIPCDITCSKSVEKMMDIIKEKNKTVDILINNAATKGSNLEKFFNKFEDYEIDVWKEVMSVNIDGMFLVAKNVGRLMASNGGGNIIQISSIYGVVAPDERIYQGSKYLGHQINTPAVYCASKAAVIGLTKYLSTYWASKNIRVNCVAPGGIFSEQNQVFVNNYSNRVPLQRMGNAEEITSILIFLSSEISSYITGQTIIVDGGLTAW